MDPMEVLQNSLKQWAQIVKFQQGQQKSFKQAYVKLVRFDCRGRNKRTIL